MICVHATSHKPAWHMQSVSKIDSTATVTHKPMESQHTGQNITKTKKRKIIGPQKHKSTG